MIEFFDGLGPRARQRAFPRTSITLAGVGCALAVIGVLAIGADNLGDDPGGGGSRLPGALLSLLATGAGYLTVVGFRSGHLATAGTVAAALGLPSFVFFATYSDTTGPNVDAIFLLSTLGWALSYAVGPGRGRPFFLGLALLGLWLFVIEQAEPVIGFGFAFRLVVVPIETAFGGEPPDFTTVGLLSAGFGGAYLALGWRLDRDMGAGAATPCTVVGLVALFSGIAALSDDLETSGTGVVLVLVGLFLTLVGPRVGRRLTTWLGGATVLFGSNLVISDVVDDAAAFGAVAIAVGLGVVAFAQWIADRMTETDEMAAAANPVPQDVVPTTELDL